MAPPGGSFGDVNHIQGAQTRPGAFEAAGPIG
jgi:hypothetical protein